MFKFEREGVWHVQRAEEKEAVGGAKCLRGVGTAATCGVHLGEVQTLCGRKGRAVEKLYPKRKESRLA